MEITLSDERTNALIALWNIQSGTTLAFVIQQNMEVIADNYLSSQLDEQFKTKSLAEKQSLLSE